VLASPVDVLLGEGDYFEPDVVFVGAHNRHLIGDRGVECPPDLVMDILSPATAHRDRGLKLGRYRHFGVPEYWIVDMEARVIERWRFAEGADRPEVVADGATFSWTPVEGGPTLEVSVGEILP
jgi:Uma2 family endonuclease